jgi:hypothetical protein
MGFREIPEGRMAVAVLLLLLKGAIAPSLQLRICIYFKTPIVDLGLAAQINNGCLIFLKSP